MASAPYPDWRRHRWLMKYRPDPAGDWKVVALGKDTRLTIELRDKLAKTDSKHPRPPQAVLDKAHAFQEIEYSAKHGLKPAPARARGLAGYLADYADAFAASHKAGSTKQVRRHVKTFMAFAALRKIESVQAVTKSICRDYLEARIRLVSHDTLKTEMRYLAPIWTRAVDDELMVANPWARMKVPGKSTKSDPVFWSNEEIALIAANCSRPWQTDLVLVLAGTGLRISTALLMRWEWITWSTGLITIPREAAAQLEGVKTAYTLALTGVARDVLERRAATVKSDIVFPNPFGDHMVVPYDSAREAIDRAIKRAGVKHGTPHDLRHSYARILERSGAPLSAVQWQLGHSSITTTQRYLSSSAEEAAEWLSKVRIGDPSSLKSCDPAPRRG